MTHRNRTARLGPGTKFGALAAVLLMAGCAVTKDYATPDLPAQTDYTPTPVAPETVGTPVTGGDSQRFVVGQDIPGQWWNVFHSEGLDKLIRIALVNSPTLASAQAAVRQSQELYNADYGLRRFPQVSGQATAGRARIPPAESGAPIPVTANLFDAAVNVTYALDIVGGFKRELEGLRAQIDYQRYQVEATYLTLTSNIVTAAIREASLRAQIKATRDVLGGQQQQLKVVQKQFDVGAISRSTVLTQQTTVAQTVATLPPLEKQLSQVRHQLAVLTGRPPNQPDLPEFDLQSLKLPPELPISLPSALVRQRPDIRASEALLHAASAQVGVATANLYPQVNLSGSLGFEALTPAAMFKDKSFAWSLGAGLTAPIFNGGALTARRRAAIAAYDGAAANYQQTILVAFQNVADSLRALESDAVALKTQYDAQALAKQSLDLTNDQYRLGAISFLLVLDAQRQFQQTQISLVQAQANRYADTAALFSSLGGGWWNREPLAEISSSAPRN